MSVQTDENVYSHKTADLNLQTDTSSVIRFGDTVNYFVYFCHSAGFQISRTSTKMDHLLISWIVLLLGTIFCIVCYKFVLVRAFT